MSHDFPRVIWNKYCFIPCPPERCNCKNGNPEEWERQEARFKQAGETINKQKEEKPDEDHD